MTCKLDTVPATTSVENNGQVYKATRTKDGKLVALKCIKQEEGDGKGFPVTAMREMRILRQLKHKVGKQLNHQPPICLVFEHQ